MRDADGVHTTFGIALAGINAFVSNADVSAATLFISCAFHQLTAVLCIARIARTTRAHSSVVNGATVGVDTARCWVFAQVSAIGSSVDVNTGRCWRTISISIVANVWIMTSNASLLSVGIANQIAGASTDVASRIVFTYGSVVAWVLFAFIGINANESSVVLVSQLAFTESLAVLDGTGTMGSTLYPVTRAFTNEMNTFLVDWAVRVMEAVHLNTAPVLVVRITRVQGTSRTNTLSLVVHYSAGCVWSTRLFFARIDALGHAVLVTGSVQWAIRIASWTFAGVRATREPVSDESFWTAAHKASDSVLADASGMAWVVQALVNIFAAVFHCVEARFAGTVVKGAELVHLAVTVRSTADLTVAVNAELSSWAVTVTGACRHAEVIDTGFSNDATTAHGSTPVLYARQALGTGSRARNHWPLAANDRCRISSKAIRTVAVGFVVADFADGIGATQALDLARILAAVL